MPQHFEKLTPEQMWPHCEACRELDDYCSEECESVIFEKDVCIHMNPLRGPCAACGKPMPNQE